MANLDLTIFIFTIILISFIISYSSYSFMNGKRYNILITKPIYRDTRFIIPCLIYTILLGLRYDYAFDWYQYQQTFIYLLHDSLYRESTEKGYLAINWILGRFGFNYYSIFLLEGFIWIFSICYLTKEDRKAWIFIIPLIYFAYRYRCLNLSRQFFATSIFLIAYKNLLSGHKMKYWILSIISCSIHVSAILYIPTFYLLKKFIKYPPLYIVFTLYIILFVFQMKIQDLIFQQADFFTQYIFTNKGQQDFYSYENLSDGRFTWEQRSLIRRLFVLLKDFMYIYFLYAANKKDLLPTHIKPFFFIGFLGIFISLIMGENEITTRMIIYIMIFYYVSWGYIFYYTFFKSKTSIPLWFKLLALLVLCHYVYSFYISITEEYHQKVFLEYRPDTWF